jgi:hypothetical protein
VEVRGVPKRKRQSVIKTIQTRQGLARYCIKYLRCHADVDDPIHELRFAVLSQAILDLQLSDRYTSPLHQTEAVDYFMSGRFKTDAILSGLEPEYVIDKLMHYRLLERRPTL